MLSFIVCMRVCVCMYLFLDLRTLCGCFIHIASYVDIYTCIVYKLYTCYVCTGGGEE